MPSKTLQLTADADGVVKTDQIVDIPFSVKLNKFKTKSNCRSREHITSLSIDRHYVLQNVPIIDCSEYELHGAPVPAGRCHIGLHSTGFEPNEVASCQLSYSLNLFSRPIRSGETLSGIASEYSMGMSDLVAINPHLDEEEIILPGQPINLPAVTRSVMASGTPWFEVAKNELGVSEFPGPPSNPRIMEYLSTVEMAASNDEVPWCSAFVNWVMMQVGIAGTNSAAAKSWLRWGIKINRPRLGCVVVLHREPEPWMGHVGFYAGSSGENTIRILGGNQSNKVCISDYSINRVAGYRWPKLDEAIADEAVSRLANLSEDELYVMLAYHSLGIENNPRLFTCLESDIPDKLNAFSDGTLSIDYKKDLVELGRKIFQEISKKAYNALCVDEDMDDKVINAIIEALKSGTSIVGIIVGYLTSTFSISSLVANTVAKLLIDKIISPALTDIMKKGWSALCASWKKSL